MVQRSYELPRTWRIAKLGRIKKNGSFLPYLAYRSIDTGHLRHLPGTSLQPKSFKETNHSLMTAPGANGTACYLLLLHIHILYATIGKLARSIRHLHIVSNGMPCWVVERQDYAELRVHVSTVCPLTTRPCSVQPSRKTPSNTRYNMSYEG